MPRRSPRLGATAMLKPSGGGGPVGLPPFIWFGRVRGWKIISGMKEMFCQFCRANDI